MEKHIYGVNDNGEVYVFVHELRKKFTEKYEGWVILVDRPDAIVGEPGTYVCTGKVLDNEDRIRATWHQLARATAATAEAGGDPYMDCQSLCELHLLKQLLPELTVTAEISAAVKKELGLGLAPTVAPSVEAEVVPDVDEVKDETPAPRKRRGRPASTAVVDKPVEITVPTTVDENTVTSTVETSATPSVVEEKETEAAMTKEEAEAVVCTYNKCKGKTMKEVKEEFPNIFAWFVKAGAQAAAKFPKETKAAQVLSAE